MGRHKEFDPDDAVEAALKVFWRKGYHEASLKEADRRHRCQQLRALFSLRLQTRFILGRY